MLGEITGVQECAPVEVADCYKRRIAKHARPKEYPLPSAAMPRVRARLMAAFETTRNALQHPHSHCETWCWHVTTTNIPPMRTHNHPKSPHTRYGRGGGTPSPRGGRVAGAMKPRNTAAAVFPEGKQVWTVLYRARDLGCIDASDSESSRIFHHFLRSILDYKIFTFS